MPFSSQPYTFDRVVRLLISIAIITAFIMLINALKDVLLPFCVACLIAYLFEPFVQYNRALLHLKRRWISVFVTLFEAMTLFGIICYFFVPSIIEELHQMAGLLQRYSDSEVSIKYLPPEIHEALKRNIDFKEIAQTLTKQDIDGLIDRGMALINGGLNVILGIVGWLMVILYVIFIMLDYDRLMKGFRLLVPPRYRSVTYKIGNDIKDSMNHYFRGQALIAAIIAVVYCVGFLLCGLPLAIVIGISTAVFFMIPYCQYLSIIPVTLLCLVQSANGEVDFWTQWWKCIMVFALAQIVADLILTPRIMGKAMGLNPAIILLSLSIWGALLGFIGLIIALPLTTLLLSYYEQYVIKRNNDETPEQRDKEVETLKKMAEL